MQTAALDLDPGRSRPRPCACGGPVGAGRTSPPRGLAPSRLPVGESRRRNTDGESPAQAPTPAPAPGVFPPNPPPPPMPAPKPPAPVEPAPPPKQPAPAPDAPKDVCKVAAGPAYAPSGRVPFKNTNGLKVADMSLSASFATDASKHVRPSCCEVRQFTKWNENSDSQNGGRAPKDFPSDAKPDTWYEDREFVNLVGDTRYGHRSGPHSNPAPNCGDEYKTANKQDMANGDKYCGHDNPQTTELSGSVWSFQLKVVDVCNDEAEIAKSPVDTIVW
jgi:hypothetical protein